MFPSCASMIAPFVSRRGFELSQVTLTGAGAPCAADVSTAAETNHPAKRDLLGAIAQTTSARVRRRAARSSRSLPHPCAAVNARSNGGRRRGRRASCARTRAASHTARYRTRVYTVHVALLFE